MFEIHMEKTRTCIVHVFRAPDKPSACEIARNLERMGGWSLLKLEEVADPAPTPREYRIRWREDAMGYDVITDTCVMDIPLTRTTFAPATGLPEKKEGILIIVSQMVKNALPDRDDLVVPTEMVRDADGEILGCRSLGR